MTATTTTHAETDTHPSCDDVVADPPPSVLAMPDPAASAGHPSSDTGHTRSDAQGGHADVGSADEPVPPAVGAAHPEDHAPGDGFDQLRVLAESYQDAQDVRIRIENRLRSGTIPVDLAKSILDEQKRVEDMIGKAMRGAFRLAAPDLYRWVDEEAAGVGVHLVARLLGATGDPIIARPHHWEGEGENRHLVADEPFERNVGKWWAYCGHGDPTRRKRKGMTADEAFTLGNPTAKKIAHLIAESAIKEPGRSVEALEAGEQQVGEAKRRYRDVYEATRVHYWLVRPEWTPGHQHNAALRKVAKEFLRDLWIEARRTQPGAVPIVEPSGGLDSASDSRSPSELQACLAVAGDPSTGSGHRDDATQ